MTRLPPRDEPPRLAETDPWAVVDAARQDRLATVARLLGRGTTPEPTQERTPSWLDLLPFSTD